MTSELPRITGITVISTAAKIYNALPLNRIKAEFEKILWENQNCFPWNQSTSSQILTIQRILDGFRAKNLEAKLLFPDFFKEFDSIHRWNIEKIILEKIAYGLTKETVTTQMMLFQNTKVKVSSQDGDTDFFDIVAGVLQRDI